MTPSAAEPSALYRVLYRHWWLAFLLLGASFGCFGLFTLNLLYVFRAAWDFLVVNGRDAIMDGVLPQLGQLILTGYGASLFYVLFKLCEKVLVARLSER